MKKKEPKRIGLYIIHKDNLEPFKKAWKEMHDNLDNLHIPDECVEEPCNYNFAVNWFGNLVGKNVYRDFSYCHVGGTNNLPYPVYVLQYAFYNKVTSLKTLDLKIKKGKFEDVQLERFRKGYLAAEFYQSIKRVQRNLEPKATLCIMMSKLLV